MKPQVPYSQCDARKDETGMRSTSLAFRIKVSEMSLHQLCGAHRRQKNAKAS